jgi:hypothetical protein
VQQDGHNACPHVHREPGGREVTDGGAPSSPVTPALIHCWLGYRVFHRCCCSLCSFPRGLSESMCAMRFSCAIGAAWVHDFWSRARYWRIVYQAVCIDRRMYAGRIYLEEWRWSSPRFSQVCRSCDVLVLTSLIGASGTWPNIRAHIFSPEMFETYTNFVCI